MSVRTGFKEEVVWVLKDEQEFQARKDMTRQAGCYIMDTHHRVIKAHSCLRK